MLRSLEATVKSLQTALGQQLQVQQTSIEQRLQALETCPATLAPAPQSEPAFKARQPPTFHGNRNDFDSWIGAEGTNDLFLRHRAL